VHAARPQKLERIVWPRVREKIEERIVEIERERRGGGMAVPGITASSSSRRRSYSRRTGTTSSMGCG
jgi:hypothetical protein